jgi:hypothetical protein
METESNSEEKQKITSKSKWIEKYNDFLDKLLFLAGIWLTIVIVFTYYDRLPDFGWAYGLDKILFSFLLFVLISITLYGLRFFVSAGIVLGIFIVLIFVFSKLIHNPSVKSPDKWTIEAFINDRNHDTEIKSFIDSIQSELQRQEVIIDAMDQKIDSILSLLIIYNEKGEIALNLKDTLEVKAHNETRKTIKTE